MLINKGGYLFAVLLISLLVFMVAFGAITVQAQESDLTPVATEPAPAEPTLAPTPTPTLNPPEIDLNATAESFDFSLQRLVELVISIVAVVLAAVFGARLIIWLLKKLTRRTKTDLDQILLEAIKPQIGWLIAAIGFQIITSRLDFIEGAAKSILEILISSSTCWSSWGQPGAWVMRPWIGMSSRKRRNSTRTWSSRYSPC